MPDVTVITVVRNVLRDGRREKFRQCLDSVRAQEGVSIEHLVVDGASDDGTLEFIESYGKSAPSLRVISKPDKGIYDAMNRGVEQAHGKYVIFLNSDDYYHDPAGLCDSFNALERTSCDFSYAPVRVLRAPDDKVIDHPNTCPLAGKIFVNMAFSHQSVMVRREALLSIGGFNLKYRSSADYDAVLRLIFAGRKACCVPRTFVTFRMGGFSSVNQDASQREAGAVFAELYSRYADAKLSPEDGLRILLAAYLPLGLKEHLFPYYVSAFGAGMLAAETDEDAAIPVRLHGLLSFKHRLLPFKKKHSGFAFLMRLLPVMSRHPLWLIEFAMRYRDAVRRIGRQDAAREAFNMMGRRLSAKRRNAAYSRIIKRAAAVRRAGCGDGPVSDVRDALPVHANISPSDFWNVYGIYEDEPWGAWAPRSLLVKTRLPDGFVGKPLSVTLYAGGYVFAESPKRILKIDVNGVALPQVEIDHIEPRRHCFGIPAGAVSSPNVDFRFELDADFVPAELDHSSDVRRLGISFGGLHVAIWKGRP